MRRSANPKFGLVLTGGGAKGAYQSGALKYLAGLKLEPHIIVGTSIKALNGAVLSSHHPFKQAASRLNEYELTAQFRCYIRLIELLPSSELCVVTQAREFSNQRIIIYINPNKGRRYV